MHRVIISAMGVEIPAQSIDNDELVAAYNAWADAENERRLACGGDPVPLSSADFIYNASGIRQRHVMERSGILDPSRLAPRLPSRTDDEVSILAEFGAAAARKALDDGGIDAAEIDMVICASSHLQRLYPAIGIEIQKELGTSGAAFDISLGCSSALAGIHVGFNLVRTGAHRRILVVTPELITGHLNFRDRQTHFIFGDAATAVVLEAVDEDERRPGRLEIVDTRSWTQFSNAIRTNFSYLNRPEQDDISKVPMEDKLITQMGNKVFKEVTVAGHRFIVDFLAQHGHTPHTVRRFWLHQANARLNAMILKMSFGGEEVGPERAPMVLDRLGNTAAAGSVITMYENHADLESGDHALLCAFGAGYSIGGALMRMM